MFIDYIYLDFPLVPVSCIYKLFVYLQITYLANFIKEYYYLYRNYLLILLFYLQYVQLLTIGIIIYLLPFYLHNCYTHTHTYIYIYIYIQFFSSKKQIFNRMQDAFSSFLLEDFFICKSFNSFSNSKGINLKGLQDSILDANVLKEVTPSEGRIITKKVTLLYIPCPCDHAHPITF